jgi:septal ring factor EnvC (AmiA/AmiB activator)
LLIVEHPFRPEFHLVSKEKPSEQARDVYRFEVKVPAGKTADLDVAEERDLVSTVQLTNTDDQTMRYFISQTVTSAKVKAALEKAVELRGIWAKTQQDLAQVQKQLKDITDDQARLRANIKELPSTSPVYKKYLDKFEKQEGEIEEMQATIKKLQDEEHKQRQGFENYLGSLDVE